MRVSLLPVAILQALQLLHPRAVTVARRSANSSYKPSARILEADACRGKRHRLLMHSTSIAMDTVEGTEVFNAKMEFTKKMERISKMVIPIWRCVGGVSPSHCEYYTTWQWVTACCELIAADGMIWTPARKSFEPAFRCPFQAGVYELHNGSFDLKLADAMVGAVLYNCFWIFQFEAYDEESELNFCLNATLEFRRVRRRLSGTAQHRGGGGL